MILIDRGEEVIGLLEQNNVGLIRAELHVHVVAQEEAFERAARGRPLVIDLAPHPSIAVRACAAGWLFQLMDAENGATGGAGATARH